MSKPATPPSIADRAARRHAAESLAAHLPPLLVAADRVASTVFQGVHGRRRVGQGETFWQFRRYQSGDPVQRIDWRQSARSQPVYIRETEWEAAQSVWLWRDGTPSMAYRSSPHLPTKADRAELLLLALASLLVRGGEQIALLGTGRVPTTGRAALNRLALELGASEATAGDLPPRAVLPRYARTVLFGDFLAPTDDIAAALGRLARQGVRGHLVQVVDPAEESLPFEGRIRFEGAEGEGEVLIGRVEAVRDEYRGLVRHRTRVLADLARSVGWTHVVHHTDRAPEATLLSLFLALSETGTGRGRR
ncbi:MAG: DUF58 domain-containing protein [Rhodobacterales bacterium]|nr:DUF58 domain-containing protein [Rhodobacterales bacterium]